ncbi:hypothetical protein [Chryseobacterium sp. W4I1]|nr:hypothetical protein [Chryseobacterium sp. W4I1]MDQ0781308.1 hypothetical protein [Chryseobacterium sp. W4I1]
MKTDLKSYFKIYKKAVKHTLDAKPDSLDNSKTKKPPAENMGTAHT